MNAVLLSLEAKATPIDWPEPETDLEDCLFAAATACDAAAAATHSRTPSGVVFVEPLRCDQEQAARRNALGGQRFEHLLGLLTLSGRPITGR